MVDTERSSGSGAGVAGGGATSGAVGGWRCAPLGSRRLLGLVALCWAAVASLAPAATVTLNAVQLPSERSVVVKMRPTEAAPKADLSVVLLHQNNSTIVDFLYYDMEPAALFGGDVTCYVAWAVSPQGVAENLGEMYVRVTSAQIGLATRQRTFAVMVTAEPHPLVARPSELLLWTSAPSGERRAPSTQVPFAGFAPAPATAVASIAKLTLERRETPELLQARATRELAVRLGATELAPGPLADASSALNKAEGSARHTSKAAETSDLARRSIEASVEAIRRCNAVRAERTAAATAVAAAVGAGAAAAGSQEQAAKAAEEGSGAGQRGEEGQGSAAGAPPPTAAAANLRVDGVTGDQVTVVANGGVVVALRVQRVTGTGGATLALASGEWPRSLRLDLVGFPGLESLVVCRGELCLETDPKRAPEVKVREGELDRASLKKLRIPITVAKGSVAVELPTAALARGAKALALRWVGLSGG